MKLQDRTVLITGGTSGIGFEMAKQLIASRNTVIITGRDPRKLDEARAALPEVKTMESDVSNPDAIQSLAGRVRAEFSACDVLINNAGIMRKLNVNDPHSLKDLTQELDINLTGSVQMVQAFLPQLKARPNALIVNVSSGLAFIPFPLSPVYSASKAGLHAFTRCLRVQLKGSGITVVELAPPGVETKLFRGDREGDARTEGHDGRGTGLKSASGHTSGKDGDPPWTQQPALLVQPPRPFTSILANGQDGSKDGLIRLAPTLGIGRGRNRSLYTQVPLSTTASNIAYASSALWEFRNAL